MDPWLLALAGAVLVLLLALRLRGPRNRTDLRAPPRRRPRRIPDAEVKRLGALVARGDEDEALRAIRRAGYDEAEARRLVRLIARLESLSGPSDPPPDPGWTEEVRGDDGLGYGRAFDYNRTLHDRGHRNKR
ncbi:MAG: hypothetical protein ABWX67_14975 [Allosphingosinicella sp.]